MGVSAKGLGNDLFQLCLDFVDVLAGGQAGPIADAKDMRVYCEGFLAEGCVQHNVGSLAAYTGKRL